MGADLKCSVCHGPFSEVSGHVASPTMRWCGTCTRKWVKELVSHTHRRWGGYRFYDHAKVPPPEKKYFYTFVAGPTVVTEIGYSEEEAYNKTKELIPNRDDVKIVVRERA